MPDFESLEEEYQSLTSQIQRQLGRGEKTNATRRLTLKQLFLQCDSMIQQMSVEARGDDGDVAFVSRLQLYRIQLQAFKDYTREMEAEVSRCDRLMSRDAVRPLSPSKSPAAAVATVSTTTNNTRRVKSPVDNNSRRINTSTSDSPSKLSTRLQLDQQNRTLERARRSIADVEEIAGDINLELGLNRETLEKSHDKVLELSGLTNDANRILTRMKKRWWT